MFNKNKVQVELLKNRMYKNMYHNRKQYDTIYIHFYQNFHIEAAIMYLLRLINKMFFSFQKIHAHPILSVYNTKKKKKQKDGDKSIVTIFRC